VINDSLKKTKQDECHGLCPDDQSSSNQPHPGDLIWPLNLSCYVILLVSYVRIQAMSSCGIVAEAERGLGRCESFIVVKYSRDLNTS